MSEPARPGPPLRLADQRQSQCPGAARAAVAHGSKADERIRDGTSPSRRFDAARSLLCVSGQIYSKMVQHCFDDCINDFSSKSLGSREENCVLRCVDKQMKASQRMSLRFQEQNAAVMGPMQGR